jgi:hypothetical protein
MSYGLILNFILKRKEKKMKFLIIRKAKDALFAMPPAALKTILETSIAAMEQQKKQGKVVH